MAMTPKDVDDLFEQIKKLLEMWMRIKLVFLKAFGEGEITKEQEGAYLQLKSEISRVFRIVSERLPAGLKFDGEKMMDLLKNAITMDNLRQQPLGERQNIYRSWHLIYVKLTRTLGALETMKAGYFPAIHRARLKKYVPPAQKKIA